MSNTFHLWQQGAAEPYRIDPHDWPEARHQTDDRYFLRVLAHVDHLLSHESLDFLLTWHLDQFEQRFRGTVVILVGDEMYRVPAWASQVRAIFKTGGVHRNPLSDTVRLPASLALRVGLRDVRNVVRSTAYDRRRYRRSSRGTPAPIFALPLGYHRRVDVAPLPLRERPIDVFFAGSGGGARVTLRPRDAARMQMHRAIRQAQRDLPELTVDCVTFKAFGDTTDSLDAVAYSRRLMNAKVALCPRGNFDETFRLFEAAQSGCVLVTERLPRRWYYASAPVVAIERWAQLPSVLDHLTHRPEEMTRLSEAAKNWWTDTVSERAVARYIVDTVGRLPAAVPAC